MDLLRLLFDLKCSFVVLTLLIKLKIRSSLEILFQHLIIHNFQSSVSEGPEVYTSVLLGFRLDLIIVSLVAWSSLGHLSLRKQAFKLLINSLAKLFGIDYSYLDLKSQLIIIQIAVLGNNLCIVICEWFGPWQKCDIGYWNSVLINTITSV